MSEQVDYNEISLEKVGYILAGGPLQKNVDHSGLFQGIADIVNKAWRDAGMTLEQHRVTAEEMQDVRSYFLLVRNPEFYLVFADLQSSDETLRQLPPREVLHAALTNAEFHLQLNDPETDDQSFRELAVKYHREIKHKLPPQIMGAIRNNI